MCVLIGDWNARVRSSLQHAVETDEPEWDGVCGQHGLGRMNESGEALLSCVR